MTVDAESLRAHLAGLPPGPISDATKVQRLLADAWDCLAVPHDGGMKPNKLYGRMEDVRWSPPILKFVIERHGGTVLGSTRAELQSWSVDVEAGVATQLRDGRFRQLQPAQPRLDVKPLVDAIAAAILRGADDPRLKWSENRKTVHVQIGAVIPDAGFQQTTAGRRKRFRTHLSSKLSEAGWFADGSQYNVYHQR